MTTEIWNIFNFFILCILIMEILSREKYIQQHQIYKYVYPNNIKYYEEEKNNIIKYVRDNLFYITLNQEEHETLVNSLLCLHYLIDDCDKKDEKYSSWSKCVHIHQWYQEIYQECEKFNQRYTTSDVEKTDIFSPMLYLIYQNILPRDLEYDIPVSITNIDRLSLFKISKFLEINYQYDSPKIKRILLKLENQLIQIKNKYKKNELDDGNVDVISKNNYMVLSSKYGSIDIPKRIFDWLNNICSIKNENKIKLIYGLCMLYGEKERNFFQIPQEIVDFLGITHDMFASPFSYCPRNNKNHEKITYSTAYPFICKYFGSDKYFFNEKKHLERDTVYNMNPPMISEFHTIAVILSEKICEEATHAVTCVIHTPPWSDSAYYKLAITSKFLTRVVSGFSKRNFVKFDDSGTRILKDFPNGIIFFLQNELGKKQYIIDDGFINHFKYVWYNVK